MGVEALFAALADKTRVGVVELLSRSPASAGELAEELAVSPALLTRHLRTLRDLQIVRVDLDPNDNRRHLYELNPEPLVELRHWSEVITSYWTSQLGAFADHLSPSISKAATSEEKGKRRAGR